MLVSRVVWFAVAVVAISSGVWWVGLRAPTVTIDPSTQFQTIDGWELTADLPDVPNGPEYFSGYERLLENLASKGGINRIRLEVRAGAETSTGMFRKFIDGQIDYENLSESYYVATNDNDDPFVANSDGFDFSELDHHVEKTVLPLMEILRERGERLIVNLCYVAFISGPHVHRDPEEYAEFVLATYQHLDSKYGFTPDMWEVILEPDLLEDSWTPRELGEIIVATARRLRESGFEPAFVAPSVTDMSNAVPFFEGIEGVEGAIDDVVEFSYHRYGGRNRRNLESIAQKANELGIRTSMLEWWFGNATDEVLHEDLKYGNVSAWQGRVVRTFFQKVEVNGGEPDFRFQPDTLFNSVYFRNIRSGAVRVAADSSTMAMDPVAFVNTDGTTAVLIRARWGTDAVIEGLPGGVYRATYTTETGTVELLSGIEIGAGGSVEVSLPGSGLLLITDRPALVTDDG